MRRSPRTSARSGPRAHSTTARRSRGSSWGGWPAPHPISLIGGYRIEDAEVVDLSPDLAQVRYTLHGQGRVTRRTTLYRRTVQGWQAVFHQGTVVAGARPLPPTQAEPHHGSPVSPRLQPGDPHPDRQAGREGDSASEQRVTQKAAGRPAASPDPAAPARTAPIPPDGAPHRKAPLSAPDPTVVRAYSQRAQEYSAALGTIDAAADQDRSTITAWALACQGTVVDAGCGPGHWTAHLHGLGVRIEGVDPVERFIRIARSTHRGVAYHVGSIDDLAPSSCGGVLAWYSLIHTPPETLHLLLGRIHDALLPGGRLLLGFFAGERVEPFDHAVTTAWYWPPTELARRVADAGLEVCRATGRAQAGARDHGEISARRAG